MATEEDWKIFKEICKNTQIYAKNGMTFRDPQAIRLFSPSVIDEYIVDLNRDNYNDKRNNWTMVSVHPCLMRTTKKS